MNVLGVSDNDEVVVDVQRAYPIGAGITCTGNVDLASLLRPFEDLELMTVLCGSDAELLLDVPPADVILNCVYDPDTSARALSAIDAMQRRMGLPVVNAPDRVLQTTRDGVFRLLADQAGVVMPRVVRIQPRYRADVPAMARTGGLETPFLVREAGTHGGKKLTLVEQANRLDELDKFAFTGADFYVTEFIDFRSPDDVYRKYRVIVIDGVPHARHLVVAGTWNIHHADRGDLMGNPAWEREEEQFLREFRPEDHPVFSAMALTLGLDYFGVDFAVGANGDVIVFEANACFRVLWEGHSESVLPSLRVSDGQIRDSLRKLLRTRAGLTDD